MINRTDISDSDLIDHNPFGQELDEAEIDGFINEANPDRILGYTDLVGYWPEAGMAVHVTATDTQYLEAGSLDEAVTKVK